MTNVIELIKVRAKAKVLLRAIGNHTSEDELTEMFLSNAPNDTLTGQAYEDLHYAYHALERFIDSCHDVIDSVTLEPADVPECPEPTMLWVTAGDMAYIDISSRTLRVVMLNFPEILETAAYGVHAPENWKQLWNITIEKIRNRFL